MIKVDHKLRFGLFCAIAAQVIWGAFPLYVDLLRSIKSVDIVAHRVVWSFGFLVCVLFFSRKLQHPVLPSPTEVRDSIRSRKTTLIAALAALLISINWICFVWSVTHDQKIEASLGYYICPQVVVLLGVVFLKERLNPAQWVAVVIAALGVVYLSRSTIRVPWISLVIAFSFGFYGLVKKKTKMNPLVGLTFETGWLLVPAILFLAWRQWFVGVSVVSDVWWINILLVGTGVATVAPLALYATAMKYIPLSTVGLLQFIGPTIQFLLGVFVFNEPFDQSRLIGFMIVWTGVGLYLFSMRRNAE